MAYEPANAAAERVLQDAYLERGLFLVLGAGISLASGLPAWPDPLHQLFSSCYPKPHPELFDKLTRQGMPLPVLAILLEENAGNEKARRHPGRHSSTWSAKRCTATSAGFPKGCTATAPRNSWTPWTPKT